MLGLVKGALKILLFRFERVPGAKLNEMNHLNGEINNVQMVTPDE